MSQRRKFSAEFKAKVALEALIGELTLSELANNFSLTRASEVHGRGRATRCRKFLPDHAEIGSSALENWVFG